jgi:YHS domain-containing protein
MYLDSRRSGEQFLYQGSPYYFCCAGCRELFEANPIPYLAGPAGAGTAESGSGRALRLAGEAMRDLSPQARTLAAHCMACPGACQALEQLYGQWGTAMRLEDWAHRLGRPVEEMDTALSLLEEWALVDRVQGGGLTFFRLSSLPEPRLIVEEFLGWRRKWALQLDALGDMLKIQGGKEEPWSAIRSAE